VDHRLRYSSSEFAKEGSQFWSNRDAYPARTYGVGDARSELVRVDDAHCNIRENKVMSNLLSVIYLAGHGETAESVALLWTTWPCG
jgi:hypothetical protein